MYAVAIVDDEIHAIRHLNRMLEECVPEFNVVGLHTNAQEALNDPACCSADILFVDIIMPVMSGLDFSKRLLSKNPYATIVFLTAYRDFDYAKQALEIGASNYWVKHELRKANIAGQIKGLLVSVDESRQARHSNQRKALIDILSGNKPFYTIFPEGTPSTKCFILYLQSSKEVDISSLSIPQSIKCVGSFSVNNLQIAVGSVSNGVGSEFLCKHLNDKLPQFVTGGLLSHFFKAASYEMSKHAAMLSTVENCIFGLPRLLLADKKLLDLLKYDMSAPRYLEKNILTIADQRIAAYDTQGLIQALAPLWNDRHLLCGNKQALKYTEKRLDEMILALGLPKPAPKAAHSLSSLKDVYYNIIQNMAKLDLEGESPTFKVRRIRNYIHKHMNEDLSLKKLTKEFNISGDYLRKVFKNETGIAISKYITKVRMDEARHLLQTGNYKVYEIAEMVGYNSSHYFSQTYYKETGHYPTEYLEAMRVKP